MGTLVASVKNECGKKTDCRIFVDSGSESNFITEQCVSKLGLKKVHTQTTISGIAGATPQQPTGEVRLTLHSKTSGFSMPVSALVLPAITGLLPRAPCGSDWAHLVGLKLSDPMFHRPGAVDILLGAELAASLMLPEIRKGPAGTPVAQNTVYGWMLSGSVPQLSSYTSRQETANVVISSLCRQDPVNHASRVDSNESIQLSMAKFWELEEPPADRPSQSKEDAECEAHFASTHTRNADGSYTVELPFKPDAPALGSSREAAVKRWTSVERRLARNPTVQTEYVKVMRESLRAGFLELVPPDELKPSVPCYYMPHREVVKDSSSTTKVRVVYDASAKTSSGVSLNDVLCTGPKLQVDLVPLLMRFMSCRYAMSADIEKFYPQTHVDPKHVNMQRLVWRENPDEPLADYRMRRVTFGVTSAPYLAIRALHQLAEDEGAEFPQACSTIKEDFLVDNLLSGASSVSAALSMQAEIIKVMEKGNLRLRKWSSNSPEIVNAVPVEHRESASFLSIGEDTESIKTIGILWQPELDTFSINVVVPELILPFTKRTVLSAIARTFDPLGWLSPVTVRPKILMQELWKLNLGWDSPLASHLEVLWKEYVSDLQTLSKFKLARCVTSPPSTESKTVEYELHGFCDASQAAYSACVFVRAIDEEGRSRVNLLAARTKVAPVKTETIPRLELCGAVLLTKLVKSVLASLRIPFRAVRCWTDSTTVLDWNNSSKKLPVFVHNRVLQMQTLLPPKNWAHVKGEENPADAASRGTSASALLNNSLWLHGPAWLATYETPRDVIGMVVVDSPPSPVSQFVRECSSHSKMVRYVAYWIRFGKNCRNPKAERASGPLTTSELKAALTRIVLLVQAEAFPKDLAYVRRKEVPKSNLKFLSPFLDEHGVLRVGGRLQRANVPWEKKHPILLPKAHNFTLELVRHLHLVHLHAPPQMLHAIVRDQFWIVRGSDVVKSAVHRCVVCHRFKTATAGQFMGQLPPPRVSPARPFSQCGVDFAGPFVLSLRTGRNPPRTKSYVALFVCMATRAIHLELVSDLSTPAFLAALTRFTSRRGLPADVYCDEGRNFVGSWNEIKEWYRLQDSTAHQTTVTSAMALKGVAFHFNPPASPHHGGVWEAGVKQMKIQLKRVIGERVLTTEEFSTLLSQVESCLNSRPLTPLSTDPSDFSVLTPGHFLVGDQLSALPVPDLTTTHPNRLSRWETVQQLSQHFWARWSSEYLGLLQQRPKWFQPQPDIDVGILVLIRDDEPTWGLCKWKLGRVTATFPGPDGKVRVCEVKTANGSTYRRPIVKLAPLPIYN